MQDWVILKRKVENQIIKELFMKSFPEGKIEKVLVIDNPIKKRVHVHGLKLGILIGKQGNQKRIFDSQISRVLELKPHELVFEEGDFEKCNESAQYIANEIALRGKEINNFKRAANFFIKKLQGSISGLRITLKGVIRGSRASKITLGFGNLKVSGAMRDFIDSAQAQSVMDMGVVNISVSVVKPGIELPDKFFINERYL